MVNWLHILIDSKAARAAHCSLKIVDGKKQPPDGPFKVGGCINLAADQIVILDIFRQALGFAVKLWNTPDVTQELRKPAQLLPNTGLGSREWVYTGVTCPS